MPANTTLSAPDASGGKFIDLTFSNQGNVDHEVALKKLLAILHCRLNYLML
jgi:hypothetical protein